MLASFQFCDEYCIDDVNTLNLSFVTNLFKT